MDWYSPLDTPQLLPKDLLRYARKFTKEEVETYILRVVKNIVKQIINDHFSEERKATTAVAVPLGSMIPQSPTPYYIPTISGTATTGTWYTATTGTWYTATNI